MGITIKTADLSAIRGEKRINPEGLMNRHRYVVIVYEVEAEDGGRVDVTRRDDFTIKKSALEYYKNVQRNEENHNFHWNLPGKYKEVEILIYLYEDFKVIKRSIIKKRGAIQK